MFLKESQETKKSLMTTKPYFRTIDLTGVPVPDFVESFSYEEIRAAAIARLIELQPDYLVVESDPAIKVIEAFCYREMLLRQRINDGLRANTITLAKGADLATIGAFANVAPLKGEDEARFRARVQQGFAQLAAAGPRGAYRAHVMGLSTDILDVGIHSPTPGEVVVSLLAFEDVEEVEPQEQAIGAALFAQPKDKKRILCRSGSDIVARTRNLLNEEDIRPLTDQVTVRPAHATPFDIVAKLVIYPGPDRELVLAQAKERLAAYLGSIRKVGYDATRSGIMAALNAPAVQNVALISLQADIVCGVYDVAVALSQEVEVSHVDV